MMDTIDLAYRPHYKTQIATVVVLLCSIIVILTIFMGLWNYGMFFPSWVRWNTFAAQVDVVGNHTAETAILTNRHLSISDSAGNQYITPDEWLVSDVYFGDITKDGTPEVILLVWRQDSNVDNPTFRLPLIGNAASFSEYIYVCDYANGELDRIWSSQPLYFNARDIYVDQAGLLRIELESGNVTSWRWRNPGFILDDDDIPENISTVLP